MIIELLIIFFSLLIFLRVINIIFPITEGKKKRNKSPQLDESGYNILTDKIDNQGVRINELNNEIDNRIKEAKIKEDENLVR